MTRLPGYQVTTLPGYQVDQVDQVVQVDQVDQVDQTMDVQDALMRRSCAQSLGLKDPISTRVAKVYRACSQAPPDLPSRIGQALKPSNPHRLTATAPPPPAAPSGFSLARLSSGATALAASVAESSQAVRLLGDVPELVLPDILHDRVLANVTGLEELLHVAKEPVHVLCASPHPTIAKLGPLFLAVNNPYVSGPLAELAPGLASTEVSHICGLPCGPCEEGDVSERVPQESTQTGVSNNAWVRESFVIGAGSTKGLLFGVK